jgi:hypothetical protein
VPELVDPVRSPPEEIIVQPLDRRGSAGPSLYSPEGSRRDVEDCEVGIALGGEPIDERRGSAADVDDRLIERRRQELDQLERGHGCGLEPADIGLAAGLVGGVPIALAMFSRQAHAVEAIRAKAALPDIIGA